ncbi:uncharacterized protein LOC131298670 [Rhododendron vialii]|uniref:uncharacterized protein LOC131298670 n=1 Tax=Rhododendron vialii TaxID=182163 RepID=UPI00265E8F5B|nr:uncharacterized protein LOC131298670 [Rhododendron vialii]
MKYIVMLHGMINNVFSCTLINIYVPNDVANRRSLWEELLGIKIISTTPRCIGGDFNEIKAITEGVGCQMLERGMKDFLEFCNNMELIDLPMLGRKFTWTNYQDHAIHNCLDRFLISPQWMEKFKVLQWGLHRPISDHCPIVLLDDGRDWGPKPFRFMDIWLSNPKCMAIAKDTWENTQVSGWAGYMILQKCRAIKEKLKVWNKEEFGDVNSVLQIIEAELHQFDLIAEERQLSADERASRCKSKSEFWRLSRLTESLWRQKSRVNWMKLGNKNTRYFQAIANNRFRRNMVGSIKVNGTLLEDPKDIKEAAIEHFRRNFHEEKVSRPMLGGTFQRKLDPDKSLHCGRLFEEGEILEP